MRIFFTIIIGLAGLITATPALALTVSPAKLEITADPGQTFRGKVELFNEQATEKTFFASFENFEPRGDSGAPYFIGAKNGLATWLSTVSSVTLKPGERLPVYYSITIPKNTEPGGYFAAMFWGNEPPRGAGSGEVSIGGKIGILILLRVSGEIKESGGLLNFTTQKEQRFLNTLPVTFEYRLNNTGGDRAVPRGEIKIKNTFRLTSATLLANKKEGSVLPGSARKFAVTWGEENQKINGEEVSTGFFTTAKEQLKNFHFGWYTANLALTWGETNQVANSLYHFFIIPWQLLIIILITILVLGFVARVGLKKYNKFIIAQALRK